MRKMVLAGLVLLASVMVLMGCDTNAEGGDNEVSNNGTYIKPKLPENSGKDPFEGKTLLIDKYSYLRFKVDTSNKTLVCQITAENGSTSEPEYRDYVKWTYSYDNLTDTPTITLQHESIYDTNGKVIPIPEYIDLSAEWVSKSISDEAGQKLKKHLEDLFSRLATYAITLEKTEKNEDKIGFEGKYDSNYEWYDQITGNFTDTEYPGRVSFNFFNKSIENYSVTSITGDRIHCEKEGETKIFSYEKSQVESNSDMTIAVTVGDESIPCIWVPGTIEDLL